MKNQKDKTITDTAINTNYNAAKYLAEFQQDRDRWFITAMIIQEDIS